VDCVVTAAASDDEFDDPKAFPSFVASWLIRKECLLMKRKNDRTTAQTEKKN
jgi:hypothetical protein